jgi:endonuclease/exonuclease/phosphatase family metal-dependent hydrolase
MRVVTYNVRAFRDGRQRVASVVKHLQPDVLLLQETGSRGALRRFARDVGMRAARDPWSPLRRRVKNAVLLAEPWRFVSVELVRYGRAKRWYPRGALVARAATDDHTLCALSIHFGLDGAERGRQAVALEGLVAALDGDVVVAGGDLNATPEMRAPARIAAKLSDAWAEVGTGDGATFPAFAPAARIDYVFVAVGPEITGAVVGGDGASEASDHLPVAVDLAIAKD